jgi:hypothetical protein
MSHNTFGLRTVPPPPQQPPIPGYSPQPPGPPANIGRRRWPTLLVAGAIGAVATSAAAALITVQARDTSSPVVTEAPAPVTVTVAAPTPASPPPLPTAQADRQTCQEGFLATQAPTKAATDALAVLPAGMKVLDPAVQQNPEWTSAVRSAGAYYTQASEALRTKIAPGATPVLAEAANTTVKAFRVLGDSYTKFEPIAGNAHDIAVEASDQMVALCTRLAP